MLENKILQNLLPKNVDIWELRNFWVIRKIASSLADQMIGWILKLMNSYLCFTLKEQNRFLASIIGKFPIWLMREKERQLPLLPSPRMGMEDRRTKTEPNIRHKMEKTSILGVRIHELHSKSLPNFNTDSTFNRINHKSIWKKLTQSYQRNCSHMSRIIDQCVPALWMQLYQKLNENKGPCRFS